MARAPRNASYSRASACCTRRQLLEIASHAPKTIEELGMTRGLGRGFAEAGRAAAHGGHQAGAQPARV